MNKLNVIIEKYSEAKKQFQAEATQLLKEEFKEFFKKVPEVKVIKWTQYTPYFNDGDPCEFSVYGITFSNAEGDEVFNVSTWGEYGGKQKGIFAFEGTYYIPDELKKREEQIKEMESLLHNGAMEEVLEATFGDHVQVTVTAKGIDVDDYEHD
jgi:hypothetical protein